MIETTGVEPTGDGTTVDEPLLDRELDEGSDVHHVPLLQRIRALFESQSYGVLCTQGGGQPYGSVVAFAFAADLAALFFATPMTTRKFHLLSSCDRVAMVIDSRSTHSNDLTRVEAVTLTGRAVPLDTGPERDQCLRLLLERHSGLRSFFRAPTTALVRIEVTRYLHVSRFQEVSEWAPAHGG